MPGFQDAELGKGSEPGAGERLERERRQARRGHKVRRDGRSIKNCWNEPGMSMKTKDTGISGWRAQEKKRTGRRLRPRTRTTASSPRPQSPSRGRSIKNCWNEPGMSMKTKAGTFGAITPAGWNEPGMSMKTKDTGISGCRTQEKKRAGC